MTLRYGWESWIGGLLLALMAAVALLGPFVAPFPPNAIMPAAALRPPSWSHLFGTDALGRDLFSRVLVGARISLGMAAGAEALALALGVTIGLISGIAGGWIDGLLMGLVEVLLAFPGIILALAISSILGPGFAGTALAIGIAGTSGVARVARSAVHTVRVQDYVLAARVIGVPTARLLWRTVLPNIVGPILALATVLFQGSLLAVAGLSFIGLGAQPPAPEWGALLVAGRLDMAAAPWLILFPGLALFLTALGTSLLGNALP